MKLFIIVLISIFFSQKIYSSDLEKIRENYSKVLLNKELCKKMITELSVTKDNSVTYLAYLGGYQTIWANHVFNPIGKLNTFKKGKKNIEQAISQEPENVELRFIRLSVQKNAPSFLGYNTNIKEDTEFIIKHQSQIKSKILKKNIESFLEE